MSGGEPTLTESPVSLALAKLQQRRPVRLPPPRGLFLHRPSLPLASLQEALDESPRRLSNESHTPDTDEEDAFADIDDLKTSIHASNGRRASDAAAFAERYRKLEDDVFDKPPVETPRRASVAVASPGEVLAGDKGRRRSWAARLQLERKKRRKSGGADADEESDVPIYRIQKRPSWWNVFGGSENVIKNRY